MAATRLIPLHVNKGKTLAASLADRVDYAQNPEKTEGGKLISSYECDPYTASQEFLLSKRLYEQIHGRKQKHDVIAYQIRQSFEPGEISPEEANQVGYELAMSFTKGKYSFTVSTHTDRAHIHNHIIFNSTSIDGTRKFRNFFLSSYALQRASDRICLEHGLSIIETKRYRDRARRTEYPEKQSFRNQLKSVIDDILSEQPGNFSEFLVKLEERGFKVKRGRHVAVLGAEQKRYIRLDSLKAGYTETDIDQRITSSTDRDPLYGRSSQVRSDFSLLIDVQKKIQDGKGAGYEKWAKLFNLKQMAQVLCYLQEHGIDNYSDLEQRTSDVVEHYDALADSIKSAERRLQEIAELKKHIINYSRTREVFAAYKKSGYSRKYYEEHREELILHKAAKEAFDRLSGRNIPKIRDLNEEYAAVLTKKRKDYSEYRAARKEMKDLVLAKKNIDIILEKTEGQDKEKDKDRENSHSRK